VIITQNIKRFFLEGNEGGQNLLEKHMYLKKIKIGILAYKYGENSLSYTITEKGTVTIPARAL